MGVNTSSPSISFGPITFLLTSPAESVPWHHISVEAHVHTLMNAEVLDLYFFVVFCFIIRVIAD